MVLEYENEKGMTATERDSIENSIRTIAMTPYATAPFIRSMGIKNYPPESNSDIVKNQYATEVMAQSKIWEDRVKVSEVHFNNENEVRMVIGNG